LDDDGEDDDDGDDDADFGINFFFEERKFDGKSVDEDDDGSSIAEFIDNDVFSEEQTDVDVDVADADSRQESLENPSFADELKIASQSLGPQLCQAIDFVRMMDLEGPWLASNGLSMAAAVNEAKQSLELCFPGTDFGLDPGERDEVNFSTVLHCQVWAKYQTLDGLSV